jgi:hypothetical protein
MAHLATYVGCIYVAPVANDGTLTAPWEELGEAYPLSIQLTDADPIAPKGRTCETEGKTIDTKTKTGDATGSLTLHEYTAKNVARALKGIVSINAVPESTLADVEIELKGIGQFIDIGKEDLSGVTVTTMADIALVEGIDFKINKVLGIIAPLTEAVANTTIQVSGTSAADSGTVIRIGAGISGKYAIKGHLINEFSRARVKLYLRKVLISSNAEINFVSEEDTEHETIEMTLTPEVPTGQSDYGTIDGLPLARAV